MRRISAAVHHLHSLDSAMGKRRKQSLVLLCVLSLVLALALIAPEFARKRLLSSLKKECPQCSFVAADIDVNYLSGEVVVKHVRFESNPKDSPRFNVSAKRVDIDADLTSFFKRAWVVESVRFTGLDFKITEWPQTDKPKSKQKAKKPPLVRVERIEVRDGAFQYAAIQKTGVQAPVRFKDIQADATALGSQPSVAPDFVTARLRSRAPSGGKVNITARIGLFEKDHLDSVTIEMESVGLSDFNSYFVPAEDIRLDGRIIRARTAFDVKGPQITGKARIAYEGLRLESPSLPKEILASITMDENKPEEPGDAVPEAKISKRRKPDQTIWEFMLSALADAALEIARL